MDLEFDSIERVRSFERVVERVNEAIRGECDRFRLRWLTKPQRRPTLAAT
jgi:hypothetical protein